jgi:hypothetical protein
MTDALALIYFLIAMAIGATWPVWVLLWVFL